MQNFSSLAGLEVVEKFVVGVAWGGVVEHVTTMSNSNASSGCVRLDQTFRSRNDLPLRSFRYRGAQDYNSIPAELGSSATMTSFKTNSRSG